MTTMFKICNGHAPDYLSELFPQKHEDGSQYNTRNKHQINIPRSRLELFKKSFVLDSIKLWNLLALDTREAISIKAFRTNIQSLLHTFLWKKIHKYYSHQAKTLLCDLHKRNITNSPYCSCAHIEDTYHFFFVCKNYSRSRNRLFSLDLVNIDTNLLLYGDNDLHIQTYKYLYSCS
jgi:hypothetical protein